MKTYFETYEYHNSGERPESDGIDLKGSCTATAHETLDDAIQYAESHECDLIAEIGGSWTEYKKCWFCGEWVDITTLNKNDLCDHCENYLISRGEI